MASDLHISVEMTGDREEDTQRRASAYATAILHAVSSPHLREKMGMDPEPADPLTRLRMALGAAYSDLIIGLGPRVIIQRLRDLIKDDSIAAVARTHKVHLASVVASRTRGDLCGDHVGKVQLELLTAALAELPQLEGPPDAA